MDKISRQTGDRVQSRSRTEDSDHGHRVDLGSRFKVQRVPSAARNKKDENSRVQGLKAALKASKALRS